MHLEHQRHKGNPDENSTFQLLKMLDDKKIQKYARVEYSRYIKWRWREGERSFKLEPIEVSERHVKLSMNLARCWPEIIVFLAQVLFRTSSLSAET